MTTPTPLDMNHVLQEIFADQKAILKYEKMKDGLENKEKDQIYNHYKTFIKITEELKNVQGSVEKMKQFFCEYEPLLNSLQETLKDTKIPNIINRHIFENEPFSNEASEENEGGPNEEPSALKARNLNDSTERLDGIIDKFGLSISERNYTESIKMYRFFKEMKESKRYLKLISEYEVKKKIDFQYNRLVQSLISDIFSETTQDYKEMVNFLIEIGQLRKAKLALLSVKSKELQQRVNSFIEDNKEHDESFFENLTKEFLTGVFGCLNFLQETFKEKSCLSSFSTWMNSEMQEFYVAIAPHLYETDGIQLTIYYLKRVCMIFMEKETESISLATEFQKLAFKDIQGPLDEMEKILLFNLKMSISSEDYKLYSFFPVINALEYEIEIIETLSLIDTPKENSLRDFLAKNQNTKKMDLFDRINEAYIDRNIAETLLETGFDMKLTHSMNYFWNAFFFLIDLAYSVQDTNNIPLISSQFFSLVQFKLESLYESFFRAHFEILNGKTSKSEDQVLSFQVSLKYSRILAENLDKILLFKFPNFYKENQSWKTLALNFEKKYEEVTKMMDSM